MLFCHIAASYLLTYTSVAFKRCIMVQSAGA